MRQVLDETLRLNTLATYSGRYSDEDESACGYQIPAGTPIIFCSGRVHDGYYTVEQGRGVSYRREICSFLWDINVV